MSTEFTVIIFAGRKNELACLIAAKTTYSCVYSAVYVDSYHQVLVATMASTDCNSWSFWMAAQS